MHGKGEFLGPRREEVIPGKANGLGAFGGVFTPSILTILGVIMYLRFGWVVGNVGLAATLVIVTLSTTLTFLTALSISEIATDQQVKAGGAYYMVSRSMGIETGGAIGIPLYLAQTLSVALYTVGFAESLVSIVPFLNLKAVAIVTTLAVAGLALKSARAAIRAQYVIMAVIALSLIALLLGGSVDEPAPELWRGAAANSPGFWVVFAVFFPAVTGIMAGVNMSGDLDKPERAIPIGTLAAVLVGYLIYMTIPVILAARAGTETLIADPLIMRRMALWGGAIMLGVWGATLSSAVGSILGAPRVLQALARDGVLPRLLRPLGRGAGPDDEPRLGTVVTLVIVLAAVSLGSLNVIAPVLTMFFLTTYGALNLAAGVERFLESPSFRPKFRVHWAFSLAGALGCAVVMLLINPIATVAAAAIVIGVFVWLERRELRTAWGDVRRGIWMAFTRAGLLRIDGAADAKNWRPHLLVLSGAPTKRWHLIDLARALTHNRGLINVSSVLPSGSVTSDRKLGLENTIREYLQARGVPSLVRVVTAADPFAGAEQLVSAYGLGSYVPNTILLGDSAERGHRAEYCRMIARFHEASRNVIIVRDDPERGFGTRQRIDVWWGGLKHNGGLMMVLAYLLQSSTEWRNADVVLKMVVPSDTAAAGVSANLSTLIQQSRTNLSFRVIISENRPFDEILIDSSRGADLVLLGMAEPGDDFVGYYETLQRRAAKLPTAMFVLAAEDMEFGEVLVEPARWAED